MSCDTAGGLLIYLYIKYAINAIMIIAPILLLVLGTIDFMGAVTAGDEKGMRNSIQTFLKRMLICIVILLLPHIIGFIMSFTSIESNFMTCIDKATDEAVKELEEKEKQGIGNIGKKPDNNNNNVEANLHFYKQATITGDIKKFDTSSLKCKIHYGENWNFPSFYFDAGVGNQLLEILDDICEYMEETPWYSKVESAGFYVDREDSGYDYHAKGLATDLNTSFVYTTDSGKSYRPYNFYGTDAVDAYNTFVCEVCNGVEDCKYNINYQIYKNYFEPNGWCWGGNWSDQHMDPMHFEYRAGNCPAKNNRSFYCK